MKSMLSILLLSAFVVVNMSKSFILINYELNKKEITEKYCINKDKPQMHCCGKCLLKRKLAEQEQQQKSPVFPDIKTDIQLYSPESLLVLYTPETEVNPFSPISSNLQSLIEGTSIFHPPSC